MGEQAARVFLETPGKGPPLCRGFLAPLMSAFGQKRTLSPLLIPDAKECRARFAISNLVGYLSFVLRFRLWCWQREVAVPDAAMNLPLTVDISPDRDVLTLIDGCAAGVGNSVRPYCVTKVTLRIHLSFL